MIIRVSLCCNMHYMCSIHIFPATLDISCYVPRMSYLGQASDPVLMSLRDKFRIEYNQRLFKQGFLSGFTVTAIKILSLACLLLP